jgi:predicted MPP superfamily phosphohydrolase
MRVLARAFAQPLMAACFTYFGALSFLLLLLLALDGAALVRRRTPGSRAARRRALLALIGGAVLSIAAIAHGLRAPRVREVALRLSSLPPSLGGYRVAHLSDLHVGPTLGRAFVEDVVERTNAARPDLVVITGDLVDGGTEALGPLLAPLRRLAARDGVFMVLGNHEYLSGAEAWARYLPRLGVRVLRNERATPRPELELVGLDDALPADGGPPPIDVERAFAEPAAKGSLVVALAHEPITVAATAARGAAIHLAGHTHGGQVRMEILGQDLNIARFYTPYVDGLYRRDNAAVFVSRGIGTIGLPARIGAPPEVNLLRLCRT